MVKQSAGSDPRALCAGVSLSSHSFNGQNISRRRAAWRSLSWGSGVAALAAALLLGGAFCLPAQAQTLMGNWVQQSPTSSPSGRSAAFMTYDAANGTVVLFGGYNGSYLNDTWVWNGSTWTNETPTSITSTNNPPARAYQAMAYDAASGQVVMFGGYAGSAYFNDTWVWNGSTWTNVTPTSITSTNSPTARIYPDMATDPSGHVVLFGGDDSTGLLNDTWEWNGTTLTWTELIATNDSPTSPAVRENRADLTYDAQQRRSVLFGGDGSGGALADTWEWSGANWTEESPSTSPTPSRIRQALAYNAASGEALLFGGYSGSSLLGDTWEWNGTNWTEESSATSPTAREYHSMASDPAGQTILFGGDDGNGDYFSDTWEWVYPGNFGNVNVCSSGAPAPCSNTLTLTYNVTTTTTFAATPTVVTHGATGFDFSPASGSTCAGTVTAPGTCTVNVTFTPQAPGLRTGAVELFSSTNSTTPLTTTPIYGTGQGPEATFSPLTTYVQSTGSQSLTSPQGVAVDAAGDLFIANTGGDDVVKVAANGSASTVGYGLNFPESVAVDGAGDVFIGQIGPSVTEIPAGCTQASCQQSLGSGLYSADAVAVDAAGDLFIGDRGNRQVVEVPANGGPQIAVYNLGGSTFEPGGLAVDLAGDVFIADYGEGKVLKIPAGGSTPTTVGVGWGNPQSVTLDAAGDVIVADSGQDAVIEVPVGCTIQACQIILAYPPFPSLAGTFQPYDAVTDSYGDIYIADVANNRIDAIFPESQAFDFAETSVANISGDSPRSILFQNIGNQTLTAEGQGLVLTNPSFSQSSGSVPYGTPAYCTATFSLVPGAACNLSVSFDPLATGSLTGYADFYDNSLNNPASLQAFLSAGTGISSGTEYTLTVTEGGSGSGSVKDNVTAISCSESSGSVTGTCSGNYASGAQVTLTASAASGSTFASWGGACASYSTTPTCTVTMNQAQNVSASFLPGTLAVANVCPGGNPSGCTGSSFAATFDFTTSTTFTTIQVVTQGTTGLDFQQASGGTCAAGTYAASSSCTVNVTFTPIAPGLREGAVQLLNGSSIVATQFVYGIGQGPEAALIPATQTTVGSGLANPYSAAVDAAGDVFIGDYGNQRVVKVPAGGGAQTTIASGLNYPEGVAVDGAGNVYIADSDNNRVLEVPAGGGAQTTVGSGLNHPSGVAVDGSDNVFIADYLNNRVVEVPAGGGAQTTVGSGLSRPQGVAVDGLGNVFITDSGNNHVVEVNSSGVQTTLPISGLSDPVTVAVDAAGDVFVANYNNNIVSELTAGGVQTTVPATGLNNNILGVAVDGAGDIFIADFDNNRMVEEQQSVPPSLSFGTVNVGARSADIGISVENIGNRTLTGSMGAVSGTNFAEDLVNSTCATFTLAPGTSCVEGFYAQPSTTGPITSTAAVTDNSLNGSSSAQTINLSATGQGTVTSYALTVTVSGAGSGTVIDNSSAISCSGSNGIVTGTCSASYLSEASVILTANPAQGSIFQGWGGACSGVAPTCEITMNQAFNVTASFAQQNFGSVNVCPPGQSSPAPCSATFPVTINIPANTTVGAVQVVTQGVTGLDFSLASGGTCTGTFSVSSSCNVNVAFTPLAPGLRLGAVILYANNGNLISSTMVYGTGMAPAIAFGPPTQTVVNTTASYPLYQPKGAAVDAAGDLYISDNGNQRVVKVAADGTVSTVGSGLNYPQGLAVDGAGDLYIADNNLNEVVEVTPAGVQTEMNFGLTAQLGVAVDGEGDLFVSDFNADEVIEAPAGCTTSACTTVVYSTAAAGLHPVGLAVDAAGDLFVAALSYPPGASPGEVVKIPHGCTSSACQSTVGFGWSAPEAVAVDAAGDVYVADEAPKVVEVPAGCASSACQITVSGMLAYGIAVDSKGDVVVPDLDNNVSQDPDSNQVVVFSGSQPPSLSFATTNVGSTSTDSPRLVSVQNVGNQPLSGTTTVAGASFSLSSTCGSGFTLIPGETCSESFSFTPQSTGILTGTVDFNDNNENLSSLVGLQAVDLSGIGSLNGATGAAVPDVVGMTQSAATTTITGAGLTVGTVSSEYSSSEPAGSVIGENPSAGTQVNLGSAVALLISTGEAPPPAPDPLTFENNYFVTGDFAAAGVLLRKMGGASGMATGTITIPDSTTSPGSQGVPEGADIVDGFLYWTTLEDTVAPSGNTGTFLGYPITGQQVGKDLPYTDAGTGLSGTLRVYRADVNNYFQIAANGTFTAPTNGTGVRVGSGPFTVTLPDSGGTGTGFPLNEGASLVVIYRVLSPNFPLKSVVIYDGSVIPAAATTQNVQGLYDAVGGATGEVAALYSAGGSWNSNPSPVTLGAHASSFSEPLNAGSAYAAVILSTPVNNSDDDGILDAWKTGPPAGDFFAGQPGYYDVKTQSWVPLPGAKHGEKDLFVQLDYMCGAVLSNGECDPTQEDLFPSPDPDGNDPLVMVKNAFASSGIVLHLEVGNAVPESTCTDSAGQLCQFPGEPGVIGWKNSLEFSKVWPRNFASCAAGGDCTARFPYGQKDSYHYVLFGHSLAIPAWNSRYGTLTSITAVANGTTTIVTANRGAEGSINYCPSRITISGVQGMPALNGVYNTSSCPDGQTIILSTPSAVTSNWSYPNTTLPEPEIGITSGTVTSISGYSDLGGADSAVTLALWETAPNQDMSKRANVIAGTLFHEIGHTIGLSHGGLYYETAGSYVPTFEANCKPNFQSSMNYLFQLDGVGPTGAVAYSNQTLETLSEASLSSVTSLTDINNIPATFSTSAWYSTVAPSSTASPATLHCDGTPLTGDTGYLVEGSVAPVTPAWSESADPNITFDGVPYTQLHGYNDIANIDLRQVGATGGEFASLASVVSFGNSSTPLSVAAGGSVAVGAGGTVTLGAGGTLSLSGGNVTVGSGAQISGGGTITFGTGGSATLSNNATGPNTVTAGSSGIVALPSGGNVTLSGTGTITLTSGGTITLGGGGNVTLGAGGTIALGAGGTVTIPSTGGSFTIPSGGGTITLGAGGNVTLGGGGNVTLGAGGTIALGAGGNITLGAGGNVTLGAGGTIALGGGGNITLGGGGNITLGGGGTITLGGGGTVTLGGGGNVTLGGGGTVTLGGGGNVTLGAGGNVTLGAGGTVTLGAGGTITLGAGGNVTLGAGGTVTLGAGGTVTPSGGSAVPVAAGGSYTLPSGGGTIALGAGGNITLGAGGTVTLGAGGNVTLGAGGNVTLGAGGTIALGAGGNIALGAGGNVTLGGGGATTTEMDYNTANSIVRPPVSPTYSVTPAGSVQVNWTAPAFGVVQTYTISRSVNGGTPVVIGSVSGVIVPPATTPNAPATTFTDTNPPAGTLVYTIATTLVPDTANSTPRQSAPSPPAVLTIAQTIVLGPLPSSVSIASSPVTVTATAESNGVANGQLVSFSTTGPCSAGSSTVDTTTGDASYGVSSALVTLSSTGSCMVTASQAGDSTTAAAGTTAYSAASPVSATFAILPQGSTTQSQTINFPVVANVVYGGSFSLSASATSGLTVSLAASGPCTLSGIATAGGTTTASGATTGAGLCKITASAPGNSTYSAASVTQSFTIFPAPLTVMANNITATYGQVPALPAALTYTFGPLVAGDSLATAVSGTPVLSTTATAASNAGSYPITVSTGSLAAANYSFLFVPGTLMITPSATTTTAVSSTGGTSNYGQLVTITPTVTATPAPPGTDSVLYSYTNSNINGGAPVLLGSVPLSQGYSTFLLPPGTNTITATFDGDNSDVNFQPSSASVTQVVASAPVAYINPASVSFPNTDVGSTSASISAVVTNIGTAPLNITGVQVVSGDSGPADFVLESSTCGGTLLPGPAPLGPLPVIFGNAAPPPTRPAGSATTVSADSSCSVTLAFAPNPKQGEGVRTGTLVFSDNDGGQAGATDYIALTGSALSAISASFPMPPVRTIAAGDYIWFNSELSVQGPLDPNGNPLNMNTDEVQVMVTNGSISFTNPATGTTATIPVPDALIQFVPGLTQASTTFDAANNRWVTTVPMADPASGRSQFVMPGNIFVTGVPYLVPAAISQAASGLPGGPESAQNVTWSAEFTTDTPGVRLNWQWGAAVYDSCFGNQPTSSNPTCAGDSLNLANVDVLGINSADPGKCPIAHTNNFDAGTPYNFISDLVVNGVPGPKTGPPNLYTGNASPIAGVVPAVTPVSFSPSSLVFMPVNAGQSSSPMTLTIANNNESLPLNISGVALTGSNAGDFAIAGTTCTNASGAASVSANAVGTLTLAPASGGGANSCTLTIVFTPGDLGTRTSSLIFTYATPAGMAPNETPPPQEVDLYGTGAGGSNPIVGLSAVSLNFPHQEQGTTSASQTVELVNAGGGALTINSIAPTGEFGETNTCPTYPATLPSGGSCTISVWFQPLATVTGTQTGAITITDNNNGVSGSTQTISLSGQASP